MKKHTLLVLVSLLMVLTIVIGACSKPTATSTTTAKPATTTAAPTTKTVTTSTATSTPAINKYGGTLRYAWASQVGKFGYPPNIVGPANSFAAPSLEGLVFRSNNIGEYTPVLAESWDLAPDRSSYTFHLRKGVKFHDGTDFNAAAVKWNLDHVVAKKGTILRNVSTFTIIDEYTIKANLATWDALTLNDFADPTTTICSPTAFDKNGEEWADAHPVGTGPYVFKEWQNNQKYAYEKNANYWMKGHPYFDKFESLIIPNMTTAKVGLLAGDVDAIREADVDTTIEVLKSGFNEEHLMAGNFLIYFDSTNSSSIWSNKNLREALEYAIDKESIIKAIGKGYGAPCYEIILGARTLGDPGVAPRKYDPVKAKQLLASAGYPTGGIKVQLSTVQKYVTPLLLAIQQNLADVGIQVDINPIAASTWAQYNLTVPQGNELRYDRLGGSVNNALNSFQQRLTTGVWYPGAKRPDGWDNTFAKLLQLPDENQRIAQLEAMEKQAYSDVMFVPTFSMPQIEIYSSKITSDMKPILYTAGEPNLFNTFRYAYFIK